MEFEFLDIESEKVLKALLSDNAVQGKNIRGTAIEHLVKNSYISGKSAQTLSDSEPVYVVAGITQKGKSYFEQKQVYEKEKRKLSKREWKIAIVSALIGGALGLAPTILQLFGVI